MIVTIQRRKVEVLDHKCAKRDCLQVGKPYGDPGPLRCMHRSYHGCPTRSVCPSCRTSYVDAEGTCEKCKVALVQPTRRTGTQG